MKNRANQKLKLLYLMKIFKEETDENHPLTVPQLIERLKAYGISAERRGIYHDIEQLRQFGLDIINCRTHTYNYFLGQRDFELPELKLLVDAVQSSKFITLKKSKQLIQKIQSLTNKQRAKLLDKQIYVTNWVKASNERIYYNVDAIYRGILQNKQISFQYLEYTPDKKLQYKREGELYTVSPYTLLWNIENYYLVAYHPRYQTLSHFRVDKMINVDVTELERTPLNKGLDVAEYAKRTFSMFSGKEVLVQVVFHNSLMGVVIDRFGQDVPTIRLPDQRFAANLKVIVSPAFFSWLFQFGEKAKIISPKEVVNAMSEMVKRAYSQYCD